MIQTVLTAAIAALVAFLFSIFSEVLRERRAFRHRWDRDVHSAAADLLTSARHLWHVAGAVHREQGGGEDAGRDVVARLDEAHRDLRARCSVLLLLADPDLADAALLLQREAYAVVQIALGEPDPRPAEDRATTRLVRVLDTVSTLTRRQLDLRPIRATRLD